MVPPSAFLIRPLDSSAAGEREAVRAIGREVLASGAEFPFEELDDFEAYWFAAAARVFVAEHESDVHGSYVLKPSQPGRGAHVANAGYMVARAARGQGLGRSLCEHSIMTARALGYSAMQFNYVVETNESAVRLWRDLGFEIAATIPGAFRHAEQGFVGVHVMRRDL